MGTFVQESGICDGDRRRPRHYFSIMKPVYLAPTQNSVLPGSFLKQIWGN